MDDTYNPRGTRECGSARGFTLLELLCAVAILASLMYAVPALSDMVARVSRNAALKDFKTLLATARSESVYRRQRITLCRSASGADCAGSQVVGSTDWSAVLMFVDVDHDRLYDPGTDEVIRVKTLDAPLSVSWNRGDSLSFQPDGSVTGYSNGTFDISFDGSEDHCAVVISLSGRGRSACD